jgi:hypothetical protein
MAHAIRMHATGGPEVLVYEEIQVGDPARAKRASARRRSASTTSTSYHRSGLYPLALPTSIGSEAAGVVEAVGQGVTMASQGPIASRTRAARPARMPPIASCPPKRLVKIPDGNRRHDRGDADAEGHDGAVSLSPDVSVERRRDDLFPRRRRAASVSSRASGRARSAST